jgi:integrase
VGLVKRNNGVYYLRLKFHGRSVWRSFRTRRRPSRRDIATRTAALWLELGRRVQRSGAPTPAADLVQTFTDSLVNRRSPSHVKRVREILEAACRDISLPDVADWTAQVLQAYLDRQLAAGRAPRTANLTRQTLGQFLKWCVRQGRLERNPVTEIPRAREEKRLPQAPTHRDIVVLLRACRNHDDRLRAKGGEPYLERAARIALGTGLRLGELRALLWEDVDLRRNRLLVRAGGSKSKRDRTVYLTDLARRALEAGARGREGRVLPRLTTSQTLRKATRRTRIGAVGFQKLRSWHTCRLVESGAAMPTARAQLGHQSESTTLRYYASVTPAHQATEIDRVRF